ncbi:hypothetical protein LCGC14_2355740, partial [marine sediment metagenome]
LTLKSGDAGGVSDASGVVLLTSGTPGSATGTSGGVDIRPSDTFDTSGPGNIFIKSGKPAADTANVSAVTVVAGDSFGVDRNGGTLLLSPGNARGDGGSDVILRAVSGGQGAGSTARGGATFLKLNGIGDFIEAQRAVTIDATIGPGVGPASYPGLRIKSDPTLPVHAALVLDKQNADPSSPLEGAVYASSVTDKLSYFDGNGWEELSIKRVTALVSSSVRVADGAFDNFSLVVPANTLRVGTVLKFYFGGGYGSTGLPDSIRLIVASNPSAVVIAEASIVLDAGSQGSQFGMTVTSVIRTIGASGTMTTVSLGANFNGFAAPSGEGDVSVFNDQDIDTTVVNTFTFEVQALNFGTAVCHLANAEIL